MIRKRSISFRVAAAFSLFMLVLLGLFALANYIAYDRGLHQDYGNHLMHETHILLPHIASGENGLHYAESANLASVAYSSSDEFGTYVRLIDTEGRILHRTGNLADHEVLDVRLPDNLEVSVATRNWGRRSASTMYTPIFDGASVHRGWIEVTGIEWAIHRRLRLLVRVMVFWVLVGAALAAVGGFLLARRALQPVAALTLAAQQIGVQDLSRRLPVESDVKDELSRLAGTFNSLIERLESSFERERRFTENAAHQLLTPLAGIRSQVDVAVRKTRSPESYRATLVDLGNDANEMSRTVQGLLHLAKADRLQDENCAVVSLDGVVNKVASKMLSEADRLGIALAYDSPGSFRVFGQQTHLEQMVHNLIDNALKYTPTHGKVDVHLDRVGGHILLIVDDTGIGFSSSNGARLFDRFYRGEAAESTRPEGSGLGLAVVQAIVEALGGGVKAESRGSGAGSRFTVWLPAAE